MCPTHRGLSLGQGHKAHLEHRGHLRPSPPSTSLPPFHIPSPISTAAAEALLSVTGCHPPPSHTPARSGLPPRHRTNDKSFGGRIQSPLSPDPTFQTPPQGAPLPHLGALGRDCTSALAFHPLWLSSGAALGLVPGSPEHLGSPTPGGTWPAAPVPVTVRYPVSSLRASWTASVRNSISLYRDSPHAC